MAVAIGIVALEGFAAFQQTLDHPHGERDAREFRYVTFSLGLLRTQGIQRATRERAGLECRFVANQRACVCRMIYGSHDQHLFCWLWSADRGSSSSHGLRFSKHCCMGHRRYPVKEDVDDVANVANKICLRL